MERLKIIDKQLFGILIICFAVLSLVPTSSAQVVCPPGTFEFVPGVCVLDGAVQPKFVNALPDALSPDFIYTPADLLPTDPNNPDTLTADYYEIGMYQFDQSLGIREPFAQCEVVNGIVTSTPCGTTTGVLCEPCLLPDVTVWGYGEGTGPIPYSYPGKTFIARGELAASGRKPVVVKWTNNLENPSGPLPSILPIDTTLVWADPCDVPKVPGTYEGPVPTVAHLHGGHTESVSDGLPDAWFLPASANTGTYDSCYQRGGISSDRAFIGGDYYWYDNTQEAATVWYHDHALGITRTNVYAGLAGFYIIRDEWDTGIAENGPGLPIWPYEQLIVIQDRMFETNQGAAVTDVSLFYPTDAQLAGLLVPPFTPPTGCDPPYNFDDALCSGFFANIGCDTQGCIDAWFEANWAPYSSPTALPEFFGNIMLVNGQAWPVKDVEPRLYRIRVLNGSDSAFYDLFLASPDGEDFQFWQIGSDLGLLDAPVPLTRLVIGPGERMDLLIDFSGFAGQQIVMKNRGRQPFPKGGTIDPNTVGKVMAFRVGTTVNDATNNTLPAQLRPGTSTIPPLPTGTFTTRNLILFEGINSWGRLEPMLGTLSGGGMNFKQTVTETPEIDSYEIWELYNSTPDAHPIHLHLVDFRILDRQRFTMQQNLINGALTPGTLKKKGKPKPPAVNEIGRKDTVQTYPGEVTRIMAKFDKKCWYVWHCHILSHEDHEMMRPFKVISATPGAFNCPDVD